MITKETLTAAAQNAHFMYIRTDSTEKTKQLLEDLIDDLNWNTKHTFEVATGDKVEVYLLYQDVLNSASNRIHNFEHYGIDVAINVNPRFDKFTIAEIEAAQTEIRGNSARNWIEQTFTHGLTIVVEGINPDTGTTLFSALDDCEYSFVLTEEEVARW